MSNAPKLSGCSSIDLYDVRAKLGEGTFGQVHQGTFKPTGTAVALKEIIVRERDEGMPITALREIKIMKALNHPNVLGLLDMAVKRSDRGRSGERRRSTFYMVMTYMDHDLCGLLHNRNVRFTLGHIKLYMSQLLQGVQFMHEQHVMHRDIKSANVLVGNDGSIKLADFGLARKYYEAPPTTLTVTPAQRKYTPKVVTRWYRPPELLLGEQFYTPAIDMWGVGCIFGEFFKRQVILPGTSDSDQLLRVFKMLGSPTTQTMPTLQNLPLYSTFAPIAETPRMFDQAFDNVPEEARDLLAGMLVYDPLKRLTASGALQHKFFTEGPALADPRDLRSFPSSREMDVRRRHQSPSADSGHQKGDFNGHNNDRRHDRGSNPRENKRRFDRERDRPKRNQPRAFAPKVRNKRELPPSEQIPPYKRDRTLTEVKGGLNY